MKILGHRGVVKKDKIPYQNTISAIEYAFYVEEADGVEIDVISSSDGKLFVIHDSDISKHSDVSTGDIINNVSRETKSKFVGFGGNYYKIAELSEVLYLFRDKYIGKILNIEIKQKKISSLVYEEIEKSQINKKNLIISSFNHEDLIEYRKLDSKIKLGILIDDDLNSIDKTKLEEKIINLKSLLSNNYSLHPAKNIKLRDFQDSDIEKNFWTINFNNLSDAHLLNIISYPSTNLISDEPLELRKKIAELVKNKVES